MPSSGYWKPDDEQFWKSRGFSETRLLPRLNLLLLLLGASVWMLWSVLCVLMLNLGYPFKVSDFFSLIASAGLSAACVRMVSGFILHHCGTRLSVLLNCYLLFIPLGLLWLALDDLNTSLLQFHIVAISTGLGAGFLSQVVNNSYYLFPQKMRPVVQEVPLALANLGLILVLVVVPLLVQWPLVGSISAQAQILLYDSSNISGRVPAGKPIWLTAVIWLPLAFLLPALWYAHRMPAVTVADLRQSGLASFTDLLRALALLLLTLGLCFSLLLPEFFLAAYLPAARELIIILALALVLVLMHWFSSSQTLMAQLQLQVLSNREVQILAVMYLMGMGSLLGFALSYPLLIKAIFGLLHTDTTVVQVNPVAPSVLIYGWLPVVLGLAARALGSWLAHGAMPAKVNQWCLAVMVISAIVMAYYAQTAIQSPHPEHWFFYFFSWSLVFFIAAGVFAGSVMTLTFKTIANTQLEYALNWIITLATAGAFYIPRMFADHWYASGPAAIIVGFALFYLIGLVMNWYFYLRSA